MTYTWLADGKAIKKATSATYTLSSRDVGKSISVRVVGSLASYVTTTRVSDPTEDVSAGQDFQVASTPTITGTASGRANVDLLGQSSLVCPHHNGDVFLSVVEKREAN